MIKYHHLLAVFLLLVGCSHRSSQAERDYIKNLEEKNQALEKELHDTKEYNKPIDVSERSNDDTTLKGYFTIGSTEDQVLDVMGDPTSYSDMGTTKRYQYGTSSIIFEKGKVVSYYNSDGSLKVKVKK